MNRIVWMRPAVIWVAIAALFAVTNLVAASEGEFVEQLVLVSDGRSDYTISVSPDAGPIVRHAADELAQYVHEISGAALKRAPDALDPAAGPLLVIGRDNELTGRLCPKVPYDELGDGGFAYCTAGEHIVIAGATPRGTLYGVYFLLDRLLGVRWFTPEYTYVPDQGTITLAASDLNRVHTPRFEYREIFAGEGHDPAFRQHNLLSGESNFRQRQAHAPPELDSFSHLFPHAVHNFKDLVWRDDSQSVAVYKSGRWVNRKLEWEPHPEYNVNDQLPFLNEAMRAMIADRLTRLIEFTGDEERVYGIGQDDGMSWTPDPASRSFALEHGNALSAPLLDMVIDVANRVREVHPNARFSTLAYTWSIQPPVGIDIPDYVHILLAPYHADRGKPLTDPRNRSAALVEAWSELADTIVVWDYLINFGAKIAPYPNLRAMCGTIKGLAKYPSIKGYFGQSDFSFSHSKGTSFGYLRMWLASRLLWDPDQDCQALIDEFVQGYFGDAAPFIEQYITLLHESLEATGLPLGNRPPVDDPFLTFDVVRRSDVLFDQAEAAVADQPVFLRHVRTVRLGIDYVILMRRETFEGQARARDLDWSVDARARLERFKASAEAAGATHVRKEQTMAALLNQLDRAIND